MRSGGNKCFSGPNRLLPDLSIGPTSRVWESLQCLNFLFLIKWGRRGRHFQQYFSYIMVASFIGGENWSTRRKPPTCRKLLTNFST
jgi:hypothetical protein